MKDPVRLGKVQDNQRDSFYNSMMDYVEIWALTHSTLILIVAMCLLIALFVGLIFVMTGVSATESGMQYNQFERIILSS